MPNHCLKITGFFFKTMVWHKQPQNLTITANTIQLEVLLRHSALVKGKHIQADLCHHKSPTF